MRLIPSRHLANFARQLGSKDKTQRKKRSLADNLIGATTAGKVARIAGGAIALDLGIRALSRHTPGKVKLDTNKYLPSAGGSSAREGVLGQYQQKLTKKIKAVRRIQEKPSKLEILKWQNRYGSRIGRN